jgi:cation:H+ antiporter
MNLITDNWLINGTIFLAGLYVLIKGSDWFIDGAAYMAQRFKVPDMIIGLTLVSNGTSLPEFATNILAQLSGSSEGADVALGNVTGSNVANILLVLGMAIILVKNIEINKKSFNRDVVILVIIYIIFALMVYIPNNGIYVITQLEGAILSFGFFAYVILLFKQGKKELVEEADEADGHIKSLGVGICYLSIGSIMVLGGAYFMVEAVIWGAVKLDIPTAIISSTIVAFGTSTPELAVTISGIRKGKRDIAIGNIVGSCIFNIVFVMGATSLIAPVPVSYEVLWMILPFTLGAGLIMTLLMRTGWKLELWEGVVMLIAYVVYLGLSVYMASTADERQKDEVIIERLEKNGKNI